MSALWILLMIISIGAMIGVGMMRRAHNAKLERMRASAQRKVDSGQVTQDEVDAAIAAEHFLLPTWTNKALGVVAATFLSLFLWEGMFFYAEPTFKYHVRTIWGEEKVVSNYTGYAIKGFGRVNDWKNAMTVQATADVSAQDLSAAESDGSTSVSADLPEQTIVFLDQVDSKAMATARFRLPDDPDAFLHLVHEYRTPANLLNTELVPAFKETLQATGSLMSAEEYFSGGRTEFNSQFENQMSNGIYLVVRKEVRTQDAGDVKQSADASTPAQQKSEDEGKVVFKVEKRIDPKTGQPLRKKQNFTAFGIQMVAARVTDVVPNPKFRDRMKAKQDASAQRAINREQRIQEEEQRYLAIAKGEREVAEEQAKAKKAQIKQTTDAETAKRLALIEASKKKEQAMVDKETAEIRMQQAKIDAQRIKTLADADKYERESRIKGDNALQQKLDTELAIQKVWAQAYANRAVPQFVFGAGGQGSEGSTPVGSDGEAKMFMQLMTMDAAKRLGYDRSVAPAKQ